MHWLALQFANGNAFFLGTGLVALDAGLAPFVQKRMTRALLSGMAFVGVAVAVLTATPLPAWLWAAWLILYVAGRIAPTSWQAKRLGRPIKPALVLVSLGLWAVELPYHFSPRVSVLPRQTVYVLGDSISAGLSPGERTWPADLAEMSQLRVVNLAEAGAKIQHGLAEARGIKDPQPLVIVELGGNDLLGGTEGADFARKLGELLALLRDRGCQVTMFELPLVPLANSYGRAQRTLAARYGAALIPKHRLTRVLGAAGATVDGLHLSRHGHQLLAAEVRSMLDVP